MHTPFSFPIIRTTPGGAALPPTARPYARALDQPFLGFGLQRPFVRDQKGDFAAKGGVEHVKACVGQLLGTRCSNDGGTIQGELPWRPRFGSLLYLLRHRNGTDPLVRQLAKVYVADALTRWEPRVRLKDVRTSTGNSHPGAVGDVLLIRVVYDIITSNVAGNQVFIPDVSQTVAA